VTPEELAAWGERSRAASGVPPTIEDPAVLVQLARLLRGVDEHADDGSTTAKTPTARPRAAKKGRS
jgi:hypothetical protein